MRSGLARENPATGADLRHIDTWLFDLDNTLYPLSSGLGLMVSERITQFVMELSALARDEAHALQKRYLAEEGLTLSGLIAHHGVDPKVYHAQFHDLPLDAIAPDQALSAAIARLPGRRLIFTNADARHTERVLERLELKGLFDDVFDIASAGYVAKPSVRSLERMIAAHAIETGSTAFFEDAERNLAPAAAAGMTTILVGDHAAASTAAFVDYRTADLAAFLASARVREEHGR